MHNVLYFLHLDMAFVCSVYGGQFKHRNNLCRHMKSVHRGDHHHQCSTCLKTFSRSDSLRRHRKHNSVWTVSSSSTTTTATANEIDWNSILIQLFADNERMSTSPPPPPPVLKRSIKAVGSPIYQTMTVQNHIVT